MAREAMQRAALELVAERGSGDVTVDDIAEAAGVSTRTFFNYFATKEQSLFGIPPQVVQHVVRDLEGRPADEHPFTSMRHVIDMLVTLVEDDPRETRLRHVVVAREPELVALLLAPYTEFESLAAGAIQRRLRATGAPAGHAELIVATCVAAFYAALRTWSLAADGRDLRQIATAHLDLLERGLG